jgi:hypothetical protein
LRGALIRFRSPREHCEFGSIFLRDQQRFWPDPEKVDMT